MSGCRKTPIVFMSDTYSIELFVFEEYSRGNKPLLIGTTGPKCVLEYVSCG